MIKHFIFFSFSLIIFTFAYQISQAVEDKNKLKWNNFTDGLITASEQNKKILINVYADWCKWCKRMDSDVYTSKNIQEYLNEKFISIKFNGESKNKIKYKEHILTQEELIAGFGIRGFPATIFLEANGNPITVLPGFHPPEQFLDILKFIGDEFYLKMNFDEYIKLKDE